MMKKLSCILVLVIFSVLARAQLLDLQKLSINQSFPKDLLKTRSIVLIQTPEAGVTQREPWKEVAEEVHPVLRELGIDAVAYYDMRNVKAGPDAIGGFAQHFRSREIQNVIFIQKNGNYKITVAPMGKEGIVDKGASAWQTSQADLKQAVGSLHHAVRQASLELGNFLILERPEYFYVVDIPIKKRFFSYAIDLNMDKMAVPAYEIFKSSGADSLAQLKQIMQNYPYQWEITEPGIPENDLRMKKGDQYVLLYLHTTPANIRRFLKYSRNEESPIELQAPNIKSDESVYKFYIRHIYTGDVYAGSTWDAAPTWQEALRQHIEGLRKDQANKIK